MARELWYACFYRERSMLNALGAAALALMVVDPKVFLGPSFQRHFWRCF